MDVLLTHAPPLGTGDGPDPAHRGFRALACLVARMRPPLLLHGHVHPYGAHLTDLTLASTTVRNVVGWHLFDVEPAGPPAAVAGGARAA